MDDNRKTIVALKPCGCWAVCMMDLPDMARENAREVARCMRKGYRIDRCDPEDIRSGKLPMECEKCRK